MEIACMKSSKGHTIKSLITSADLRASEFQLQRKEPEKVETKNICNFFILNFDTQLNLN